LKGLFFWVLVTTRPLLCVTVTAPTMNELRRMRDEVADADLVEVRLDGVRNPDAAGAVAGRRRPVIVTCRPAWEGGAFDGSEEQRERLLAAALKAGAEYVDVEWQAGFGERLLKEGASRIVLSNHDFTGVPADLPARYRAMRASGAGVVKVAVTAHRLSDCVRLLDLVPEADAGARHVLIAMGPHGLPTRLLAARFRSAWTYAGSVPGVGQFPPAALVDEFRFREIDEDTSVYGVIGLPVTHSVSPAMHNAAFRQAGLDAVYLPLAAVDADDAMTFARGVGLSGASVTIPHKVTLLPRMDAVDPVARRIGAINTIRREGDRWTGSNTDVEGFLRPLDDRGVTLGGLRAAIMGAGGSARAVAVALGDRGARVSVHARRPEAAAEVAALANGVGGDPVPGPGSWDVLVNCTPVGMHPRADATPMAPSALKGRLVYDLVYNPVETRLLRDARVAGCDTIGGLAMLVAQAEAQFVRWTGMSSPPGVMQAAAERRLQEFVSHANHVA
jgi:3-dehydroquinate dehydratase/shikimate dehydrogenase